jgi:SET domain
MVVVDELWEKSSKEIFRLERKDLGKLGDICGELYLEEIEKYEKEGGVGLFFGGWDENDQVLENTFLGFYVGNITQVRSGDYVITLWEADVHGEQWYVDAEKMGNEFRYLNHSHLPNVQYDVAYIPNVKGSFPCIRTLRTILDGDELVADYEISFDNLEAETGEDPLEPCLCGASFCSKVLGFRHQREDQNYVDFVRQTSVNPRVTCHLKKAIEWKKSIIQVLLFVFPLFFSLNFLLIFFLSEEIRGESSKLQLWAEDGRKG